MKKYQIRNTKLVISNEVFPFGQGLSNIGYNRSTVKDELNNFGKHLYNTYPSGAFIAPFRIGNSISNGTVGQELRNQFNDTMKYLF